MFRFGRAMSVTYPPAIGSKLTAIMTIGIVWLAATAACNFRTKSDHHVDVRADHFSSGGEGLGCSFVYPSVFYDQILSLGESELSQFSKKRRVVHGKNVVTSGAEEPNMTDLSGLLRARRERPRC